MSNEKIVSYWKNPTEFYTDEEGLVFIYGMYDHKNSGNPAKALGIHWGNYPKSHNVLSPCVIPDKTRKIILSGLLHDALLNEDTDFLKELMEVIKFFTE